jgi:hypothetical protein
VNRGLSHGPPRESCTGWSVGGPAAYAGWVASVTQQHAPVPYTRHQPTLWQIADELSRRLTHIFLRDEHGRRPVHGQNGVFQTNPHWRDLVLFYEYFHGDTGAGVGASHQTGWTALVAKLLEQTHGR